MNRCLVYLRVSSKEQAEEGYSIAAQRESCLRLIQERGWTFVDEYVDAGESARTADRPAFQAMLTRLSEEQSVRGLVVHKLDRLARNLEDHVTVRARLRTLGVELVSVTESLEESASGVLVEGILASIAEFYSANLSQEIRKGQRQKLKQGGWLGTAPIGYRNVRTQTDGRRGEAVIVVDEEQAPMVQQAFELYATGEWPLNRLYEEMEQRGLRSRRGKMLSRSKLALMLKNRAYLGKVVWSSVEYEGAHEPLISQELFDRVQEIFRLHDRAGERRRTHSHYLRGTLYCGTCGSRLCTTIAKGRFPYFFCLGAHQRRTDCRTRYVPIADAQRTVEGLYRTIRLDEARRDDISARTSRDLAKCQRSNIGRRHTAGRQLTRLEAEREKLLRAYYEDAIPLALLKKEQQRIDAEINTAEATLQLDEGRLHNASELVEVALELASNCDRVYAGATPQGRRRLNQAFFEAVYLQDGEATRATFRRPFDAFLNGSIKERQVEAAGIEPASATAPDRASTSVGCP